ncbi:hypothetical protein ACFO1B_14330 [Dactylosporangium siamense]|uniref:hypothetical protein n=1 Tax=Dactylosporangium siamense TaxID=685454 RepID=UPI001942B9BA|nr:hypothetical protein [Dactylosporangium siamense]
MQVRRPVPGGDVVEGGAAVAMLGTRKMVPGEDRRHGVTVAAQAQPDRWWFGLGRPTRPIEAGEGRPDGGRAQTTQGYLWAFTADEAQRSVWWGTVSNAVGGGIATLAGDFAGSGLGVPVQPWDDPDNVTCEFASSYNAVHDVPPAQDIVGDVVPVQVWQHDIASGTSVERTPDAQQCPDFDRLAGLRAAGSIGDVVFLGGIETTTSGGAQAGGTVMLLAYHTDGTFLGWQRFPEWDNIKNFVVAGGRLYFGVSLAETGEAGTGSGPNPPTGSVQRWRGTAANPFRFEEVGLLGNQPTYFTVHQDRIVTGTWVGTGSSEPAGVYVSPPLHELSTRTRTGWQLVFTAAHLFPDPLTAAAMVSFAVTSFEGWIYATFGIPSVAPSLTRHLATHPDQSGGSFPDLAMAYLRSSPGGVVYRIKDPGQLNQQVELLYGERRYWVFDPDSEDWALRDNLLHQNPRFGGGGFGTRFNDYVGWGAAVFRGKLYLGTFNTEKVLRDITLNPTTGLLNQILRRPVPAVEAALWRQLASRLVFRDERTAGQVWVFDDADSPARPLTTTGFNNACNWGIRGVLPVGDEHLFFGTNQGWQYPTEPRDDPPRRAGWQLLKLTPAAAGDGTATGLLQDLLLKLRIT